jgi:hypothetical protein
LRAGEHWVRVRLLFVGANADRALASFAGVPGAGIRAAHGGRRLSAPRRGARISATAGTSSSASDQASTTAGRLARASSSSSSRSNVVASTSDIASKLAPAGRRSGRHARIPAFVGAGGSRWSAASRRARTRRGLLIPSRVASMRRITTTVALAGALALRRDSGEP